MHVDGVQVVGALHRRGHEGADAQERITGLPGPGGSAVTPAARRAVSRSPWAH